MVRQVTMRISPNLNPELVEGELGETKKAGAAFPRSGPVLNLAQGEKSGASCRLRGEKATLKRQAAFSGFQYAKVRISAARASKTISF